MKQFVYFLFFAFFLGYLSISLANYCVIDDNFCDCGDDEPTTGACSMHGQLFYCSTRVEGLNVSFPSSRVGDGVCDCYDGSDEFPGLCENSTSVFLEAIALKKQAEQQLHLDGRKIAHQLMNEAQSKYQLLNSLNEENRKLIPIMEKDIANLKAGIVKAEEDSLKFNVDNRSVGKFKEKITEFVEESKISPEYLRYMIASLVIRGDEDAVESFLNRHSFDFPGNDPDDSEAMMIAMESYKERTSPSLLLRILSSDFAMDSSGNQADHENLLDSSYVQLSTLSKMVDALSLSRFSIDSLWKILPAQMREIREKSLRLYLAAMQDVSIDAPTALKFLEFLPLVEKKKKKLQPGQDVDSMRKTLLSKEGQLEMMKKNISDVAILRKMKLTPDNPLFPLWNNCYSIVVKEYTYSICPFQDAKQNDVRLGNFMRVSKEESGIVMSFGNGDICYGSPSRTPRSIKVMLVCALETLLEDLVEPEICSYEVVMKTPLIC